MKHITHFRSLITSIALLLSSLFPGHASDIKEVLPLTNQILVIRFDDGFVRYHQAGEPRTDDQVFVDPLNLTLADKTTSYSIESSNDAAYASAVRPQRLWRKSKGTEFAWKCDSYDPAIGCINNQPDHAKEHWVYLVLPSALQRGKTYTITTGDLAKNGSTWEITYDEKQLRSEAIHVNAVAYEADARDKYGYLYHWAGSGGGVDLSDYNGASFSLVSTASKQRVFTGKVAFRKGKNNVETFQGNDTPNQNFLGADVYECDFSSFSTPGEYTLVVDGVGQSFPFEIKKGAFFQPFYLAMKGLYQNRSGIELTRPYTDFPRPAPHHPKLTPGFSGRLKYTTTRLFDLASENADPADKSVVEAGYQGDLQDTWGWYQDAGDWDGYYTHSHIPGLLMFLYETGGNYTDGELNIPESGNGLPDVLDEASWLLRFYQRARQEITDRGWGTGGVPGARVYGDLWGDDSGEANVERGSWQDTDRDWYVTGEDPWISYKYAGLAAQFAYILEQLGTPDPQGINWEDEAISAYQWAKANTSSGDEAVRFGDKRLAEMRLYASASLYRLTKEEAYHNQFLQEANLLTEGLIEGQNDKMFAIWMYLLIDPTLIDAGQLDQLRTAFTKVADDILLETPTLRACRWGGNMFMPMLVGQATTPLVTAGVYGYVDQQQQNPNKAEDYLASLYTTGDYFMGTNPLNITWITGAGDRPPAQIFHLDWWTSGREDVLPGVIPYGPWRLSDIGPIGPWNPEYGWVTAQPDIAGWPGHERWFDQRSAVLGAEFTVHQNTATAAFVYGFLAKKGNRTSPPPPPPSDEGTGLSYELYNNPFLQGEAIEGIHATIDFNWGGGGPQGVGKDEFSLRWRGEIQAPTSGTYTFYARTDDGVTLNVNGQALITNFNDQAARETRGTIRLEAGKKYPIMMEYYENRGAAVAELRWSGPQVAKQIIPKKYLYPANGNAPNAREQGLLATYYDNATFSGTGKTRIDPTIDFIWRTKRPMAGINSKSFSVRWEGEITPQYSETYTLSVASDDAVRVWIDRQLIIDRREGGGSTGSNGTISLNAGQPYEIKVEYSKVRGYAYAKLRWQSASQRKQTIPSAVLTPLVKANARTADRTTKPTDNQTIPSEVQVFPNPTVNQQIALFGEWIDGSRITLHTVEGRSIPYHVVSEGNGQLIVAPSIQQPPGLYLITVTRPNSNVQTLKLMMD